MVTVVRDPERCRPWAAGLEVVASTGTCDEPEERTLAEWSRDQIGRVRRPSQALLGGRNLDLAGTTPKGGCHGNTEGHVVRIM